MFYGANYVMIGNQPAAGLMTIAIERAQESFQQEHKFGIFDPKLFEADSIKLV